MGADDGLQKLLAAEGRSGDVVMMELSNALEAREKKIESLKLALERKDEEHAELRASYSAMHSQMTALRAAAHAKLGLPPPEHVAAPATPRQATETTDENQPPSSSASWANATVPQPPPQPSPSPSQLPPPSASPPPLPKPLPKPLADALREPLQHGKLALQQLDEAASKRMDAAKQALERGRDDLARGLSDALERLRSEHDQQRPA